MSIRLRAWTAAAIAAGTLAAAPNPAFAALAHVAPLAKSDANVQYIAMQPQPIMDAESLLDEGREAASKGATGLAIADFRRSLALAPHSRIVLVDLGCALADLERWEEARSVFNRALLVRPGDPAALNGLGFVNFRTEHLEAAITCYKQAISSFNDPQYHLNLGLAYLQQESWGQAIDEFAVTIKAHPKDYWAQNDMGFALQQLGRWREAAVHYQEAVNAATSDVTAHLNLGGLLIDSRSYDDAAMIYGDALKHDDTSYEAHVGLALALGQLERYKDAEREALAAVKLDTTRSKAHHLLGQIYQKQARWKEAISEARQALAIEPKEPACRLVLARALDGDGQALAAATAYEDYLKLVPDDEESREIRVRARILRY